MNTLLSSVRVYIVPVIALVIFVSGSVALAAFTEPAQNPPLGNKTAPINPSSAYQEKSGTFWGASIGSDNGYQLNSNSAWFLADNQTTVVAQRYCLGTDITDASKDSCVRTWPTTGATCHATRTQRVFDANQVNSEAKYGSYCEDTAPPGYSSTSDSCGSAGFDNCDASSHSRLVCNDVQIVCN